MSKESRAFRVGTATETEENDILHKIVVAGRKIVRDQAAEIERLEAGTRHPAPYDQPAPSEGMGDVTADVIQDLKERSAVGALRHGTVLQYGNGRDAGLDAYQEALDLVCYLRQAMGEREEDAYIMRATSARCAMLDGILASIAECLDSAANARILVEQDVFTEVVSLVAREAAARRMAGQQWKRAADMEAELARLRSGLTEIAATECQWDGVTEGPCRCPACLAQRCLDGGE